MYPALNALLAGRIPHDKFEVEELMIVQPKLDGIWFKLSPSTLKGYTKDNKSYDFRDIIKPLGSLSDYWMNPICHYITVIKYLVGELCYVDPITKQITRNRHYVMDVLRKHKGWEDLAPNIVLVIYDVILSNDVKDYFPQKQFPHAFPNTYREIFEIFVQENTQLWANHFFKCMETKITSYGNLAEVEKYFEKKYRPLEGMIIKRYDSLHPSMMGNKFRKVHPDWFKIKPVFDATLKCVAIKPHSKNPEWVGALILESSDKQLRVSVGSGLKKEHRTQTDVIGKLFEIEFEDLFVNSKKLMHPRIIEKRYDMNEADSWEKLVKRIKG